NFEPPGVIFVVEDADALAPAPAFFCELLDACSSLLPWPRTLTLPLTLALPFSLALLLAWPSLPAETDAAVLSLPSHLHISSAAAGGVVSPALCCAGPWLSAETDTDVVTLA